MGRPPIGTRPMTAAERQRRRYWKKRPRRAPKLVPVPPPASVPVATPERQPTSVATFSIRPDTDSHELSQWLRAKIGDEAAERLGRALVLLFHDDPPPGR
jgi:hypothetical protein